MAFVAATFLWSPHDGAPYLFDGYQGPLVRVRSQAVHDDDDELVGAPEHDESIVLNTHHIADNVSFSRDGGDEALATSLSLNVGRRRSLTPSATASFASRSPKSFSRRANKSSGDLRKFRGAAPADCSADEFGPSKEFVEQQLIANHRQQIAEKRNMLKDEIGVLQETIELLTLQGAIDSCGDTPAGCVAAEAERYAELMARKAERDRIASGNKSKGDGMRSTTFSEQQRATEVLALEAKRDEVESRHKRLNAIRGRL